MCVHARACACVCEPIKALHQLHKLQVYLISNFLYYFYFQQLFFELQYVLLCTVMWLMFSHIFNFSDEIIK